MPAELNRTRAKTLLTAAAIGALLLGGCTSYEAGVGGHASGGGPGARLLSGEPAESPVWPARNTQEVARQVESMPREIFTLVAERPAALENASETVRRMATEPVARVTYAGAHGQGMIRVFEFAGGPSDWRARGLGTIRFVSFSEQQDRLTDPRLDSVGRWESRRWARRLAGLEGEVKPNDPAVLRMLYEGTAIRIVEPPKGTPVQGTIVHLCGLGSMEWEQPLLDQLSENGWWVVRVTTPRVWWYESKPWMIASKADVQEVGRKLAGVLDDLVAEPAYAVEAAIDYIAKQRPEIPLRPLVMVGCSAGALAAPAAVARSADKFDAAILVGGGANLLEISQRSDLTDGGITLAWPDNQPRGDLRNQLFKEYLKHSQLDPYRTAGAMLDKPVLLVQAEYDLTVPANNGWLLWSRLGKPDRINFKGEHRLLFWQLGKFSPKIVRWLDSTMDDLRKRQSTVMTAPGPNSPGVPPGAAPPPTEAR